MSIRTQSVRPLRLHFGHGAWTAVRPLWTPRTMGVLSRFFGKEARGVGLSVEHDQPMLPWCQGGISFI